MLIDGQPAYQILKGQTVVIDTSFLGLQFVEQPPLINDFKIVNLSPSNFTREWEQPWGERRIVLNTFREIRVDMKEKTGLMRLFSITFRLYDDGVAFKYDIPTQENITGLKVAEELTEFNLTGDHEAWWIPADYDSYEYLYTNSRVSEINSESMVGKHEPLPGGIQNTRAVNTPVTLKTNAGLHLSIHEAALIDYPGMTLKLNDNQGFRSELVPNGKGYRADISLPFSSPWRTVQIANNAAELLLSDIIINCNDHNTLGDISWIKPMKYMGIWWGMHLGIMTWGPGESHGATTENAKKYLDFASEHGFDGLLIEGWNIGWEYWADWEKVDFFDFTQPYDDFDIEEVTNYGAAKGVSLIGHHETSGDIGNYERQLDSAMAYYQRLGVTAIKTGYVSKMKPMAGEYHHGQMMVNHYRRVIEKAAEYEISIVAHEPIKPTGERRTYPNMMSREGIRGSEYNSPWGGENPPEHLTVVPFARMLAGPIDYTPGIFQLTYDKYNQSEKKAPTTLAYQLASYVIIYSPVQMASDLPENYEGHPAFQFIKDVGIDWEQSHVLDAEIGDYVVMAREERGTGNWFVGGLADENGMDYTLDFNFLPKNQEFVATIYRDAEDSHFETNPMTYEIEKMEVNSNSSIKISMKPGGGFAISLMRTE